MGVIAKTKKLAYWNWLQTANEFHIKGGQIVKQRRMALMLPSAP